MSGFKRFEDIEAWQLARVLCKLIYSYIQREKFSKDYSTVNQINKSSSSIMDNIAEGFERGGNKEFIQFLYIAKASCGELRSQLYRVLDRNYINEEEFKDLFDRSLTISKKLGALINYLKNSDYKGTKYKN